MLKAEVLTETLERNVMTADVILLNQSQDENLRQ